MSKRKLTAVQSADAESSAMAEMRALLSHSLARLTSVEDKISQMQNEIDDFKT